MSKSDENILTDEQRRAQSKLIRNPGEPKRLETFATTHSYTPLPGGDYMRAGKSSRSTKAEEGEQEEVNKKHAEASMVHCRGAG